MPGRMAFQKSGWEIINAYAAILIRFENVLCSLATRDICLMIVPVCLCGVLVLFRIELEDKG